MYFFNIYYKWKYSEIYEIVTLLEHSKIDLK